MANSVKGTVKWFSNVKGFGFIVDAEGRDYLAHHSEIQMEGYRKLRADQEVTFEAVETEKGLAAKAIQPAG